jgi:hypothetical protein
MVRDGNITQEMASEKRKSFYKGAVIGILGFAGGIAAYLLAKEIVTTFLDAINPMNAF